MLRVLIPIGFMIGTPTHVGTIAIVLCTPEGSISALMDRDGNIVTPKDKAPGDNEHQNDHAPCTFSGAVAPILSAQLDLVGSVPAIQTNNQVEAIIRDLVPGRGMAAPPPQATAPPNLI